MSNIFAVFKNNGLFLKSSGFAHLVCCSAFAGDMATKVIYFTVNGHDEQAEFRSDDSTEDVRGE